MHLGNRIVVVGVSASGKSHFARVLSQKVGIPVVHMDAIMWQPNWNYIGDEATAERLQELAQNESWLIEGYVTKSARTVLFDRATTIIHLDYRRHVAAWRYIQRWWQHRKDARPELEGCPEKFSFKFLKLVWTKGEDISLKRFLKEVQNQSKIITLYSPKEAKEFLKEVEENARMTAGGIVFNSKNEVLVVNQNGNSWSLPKGGVDEGEMTEEAARREIREESGVTELSLIKELGSYSRRRIGKGGSVEDPQGELKHITMFLYTTEEYELQPEDPDNPEARWVSIEEVAGMLTHPKDAAFFESVKDNLHE